MAKILIVEDEPGLRRAVERTLRDEGYEILTATEGREALVLVAAHNPDLVLTDVDMPHGMGGVELAQTIRRDHPSIPVILWTGGPHARKIAQATQCECFEKPLDARILVRHYIRQGSSA